MPVGMIYTVQFNAVAVTAQQDLFEYVAPADACAIIHHIQLTQSTEAGDAQEEGLSILLKSGQSTSGSGGSSVTPVPLQVGFTAAGGTAEANNTTKASTGTIVTHHADVWNVRGPMPWLLPPELQIVVSPSRRFTVELGTTPADSITCNGVMYVEEIGG